MRCHLPNRIRGPETAISLLETLIAVTVFALIIGILMETWLFTGRSFAALANYTDLDQKSRNALDQMLTDMRQATSVTYYATNCLTCSNLDGTTFSYAWDPASQQVSKAQGGRTNVLLTGCSYLCYEVFFRNPTNQFWFPYSASSQPSLTKLIRVDWRCSRKMLSQINSESVQTAKIVLRN